MEPDSSLEANPFLETARSTGRVFGLPPQEEKLWQHPRKYVFNATGLYEELLPIIQNLSEWNDSVMFFGAELVPGSLGEPGQKREWKLTVRIPEQNFGVVIKVKDLLLSVRNLTNYR